MSERLTYLYDRTGEGEPLYIGRPDHNGDWQWFPIVKVDRHDDCPCGLPWEVELVVTSPEAAGPAKVSGAYSSAGWGDDELERFEREPDVRRDAAMLAEEGISAPIWRGEGSNLRKLLKQAREEVAKTRCFIGFYLDRPVNRIGSTGWDFIQGNPLGALERRNEE